jgi:uncharacterized protein (TIGR00255 family)
MIRSMTGFAAAAAAAERLTVEIEIRTYNSRHLDLVLRLPTGFAELEDRVRSLIAGRIERGRAEVRIQIQPAGADEGGVEVDAARAQSVLAALNQLRLELGLESPVSLELVVGAGGILKPAQTAVDSEAVWPVVAACLGDALDKLDAMRLQEGEAIAADLRERLGLIQAHLAAVAEGSRGLPDLYQQRLKERIAALTQGLVEIDPARIAQEAAFLADRADISEEIVRARSHLEQFGRIMASGAAAGRKLNFLLQELNREFNTMGSKIGDAATAHVVVAAKSELEKIREQVQNIE